MKFKIQTEGMEGKLIFSYLWKYSSELIMPEINNSQDNYNHTFSDIYVLIVKECYVFFGLPENLYCIKRKKHQYVS